MSSHKGRVLRPVATVMLQGQGKGARPAEKCGVCLHCTRPLLRKGCLNPIIRSENPSEAPELASK
jgi:hypothetical protein